MERRRNPRFGIVGEAHLTFPHYFMEVPAPLVNISQGGCGVYLRDPLRPLLHKGEPVRVRLVLFDRAQGQGNPIVAMSGRLRWVGKFRDYAPSGIIFEVREEARLSLFWGVLTRIEKGPWDESPVRGLEKRAYRRSE